jgi:hypothetical protein
VVYNISVVHGIEKSYNLLNKSEHLLAEFSSGNIPKTAEPLPDIIEQRALLSSIIFLY